MIDPNQLLAIVGIVSAIGGAGVTAGATRQRIKSVEASVAEVNVELENHDKRTQMFGERLARIETSVEWIRNKLDK